MRRRDSNACAAVTSGPAANEHQIDFAILAEQGIQRPKQKRVVISITGKSALVNASASIHARQRRMRRRCLKYQRTVHTHAAVINRRQNIRQHAIRSKCPTRLDPPRFCIVRPSRISNAQRVHPTRAIAIRLTRLTETSLIVHWFTEAHGLIKTVAKGARRPGSPFAGRLDLFFGGEISYQSARKGELHALREVVIHDWREGLRKSYGSTLFAAYCCQLAESAVEPEHPEPQLYQLLVRALNHIDTNEPSVRALLYFERELATMMGILHEKREPSSSLRETLGALPSTREELIARIGGAS